MKANPIFLNQPKSFWANVRCLSEQIGYTQRFTKQIKVPTIAEIKVGMLKLGLSPLHIVDDAETLTDFGQILVEYFQYRADQLNVNASMNLMNATESPKRL